MAGGQSGAHLASDRREEAEMRAAHAVLARKAVIHIRGHGPLRESALHHHDAALLVLLAQQGHKGACQAHVSCRIGRAACALLVDQPICRPDWVT